MPQLNIHIPETSDLLRRVEECAAELELTPSALARVVLDIGLEPYVNAHREARRQDRERRMEVAETLRNRFSGALPARRLPEEEVEQHSRHIAARARR